MRAPTNWPIICAASASGPKRWSGCAPSARHDMVIGLLGILKAGGAYLPLDPDYPAERLAYIVWRRARPGAGHAIWLARPHSEARRAIVLLDDSWPTIARATHIRPPHAHTSSEHRLRHLHLRFHRHPERGDGHASWHGRTTLRQGPRPSRLGPTDVIARTASQSFDISISAVPGGASGRRAI